MSLFQITLSVFCKRVLKLFGPRLALAFSVVLPLHCMAGTPPLALEPLARADAAMQRFIDQSQMPGGVLWIEQGTASHHKAFGVQVAGGTDPVSEDTMFDVASLTKPVITATLVMLLRQQGRLDVEAPVSRYLPDCANVAHVTLRQLLTHSSGLTSEMPASDPFKQGPEPASTAMPQGERQTRIDRAIERICAQKLDAEPGRQFHYSGMNFVLLGEIVSRVSGRPLQDLARTEILEPLSMSHSGFLPPEGSSRIAPTNKPGEPWVRGAVQDSMSRRMGGVSGQGGLFSTTADLARFARMLLNDGVGDSGRRLLTHESVLLLTTPQAPTNVSELRSMGWDIATGYSSPRGKVYPAGRSFGHSGYTGCAMWIDPGSRSFYILLSNRVSIPGSNILELYRELGTRAAEAAGLEEQP